jgi:hypothetical protein
MDDAERIRRLRSVLEGTGAVVNEAFGIWALESRLTDEHIQQLKGWADLLSLVAGGTRITDASLDTICSFRRLTDLSIHGTVITSTGLAACDLPPAIQILGLASIALSDDAIEAICRCDKIFALNVNHCNLSEPALFRLAQLPSLRSIEALGAESTPETSKLLSNKYPTTLFRLRDGVWKAGECRRLPFPSERA